MEKVIEGPGRRAHRTGGVLRELRKSRAPDYVFAVVGYAGSGTSYVAGRIAEALEEKEFQVVRIKARTALDKFSEKVDGQAPDMGGLSKIKRTEKYQDLGDRLRSATQETGAVAIALMQEIRDKRREDQEKRAFVIDSLKSPGEIDVLRHVYGHHLYVVGVGCRPDIRLSRLRTKFDLPPGRESAELADFVSRDAEDSSSLYGQQVNDAFHQSDFFVDNTASNEVAAQFHLPEVLKRFLDLVSDVGIHRPTVDERGLFHAHAASLRSSCLSRQVGAAILSKNGDLLSIGTNDVPRPFGGLYSEADGGKDSRCFHAGECKNTKSQIEIVDEVRRALVRKGWLQEEVEEVEFRSVLKKTRIGSLIEFSRSVHAEMEALICLVRSGTALPRESTLYSTTYPCHNCARHIVAAGVSRVVYLEPYAKSRAIDLHSDAIADNKSESESEGKVVFVPYQGVAPRLYRRIYLKDRDLKDGGGDLLDSAPSKGHRRSLWTETYLRFEEQAIELLDGLLDEKEDHGEA